MESIIQQHWNNKELPGLNAIILGDGSIIILSLYATIGADGKRYYVSPLCDTNISSVIKYNDDPWSECQACDRPLLLPDGRKVYYGEGAMGNDGFVALLAADDQLVWAFYSDSTNPFVEATLLDGKLKVKSTYDRYYIFEIDTPEKIKVESVIY